MNGQVVIKIRPQADWLNAGETAANERRIKTFTPITRAGVRKNTEEVKAECTRVREADEFDAMSLAQIMEERRKNRGE